MNKQFALSAITGILALFSANEAVPFPLHFLRKTHLNTKEALALNGQLLECSVHDVISTPTPAPLPAHQLYGAELTGGHEAARQAANVAAAQEILKDAPEEQILRAYSGGGGIGESVDQFFTPAAIGQLMFDLVTPLLNFHDKKRPVRILEPSCGNGALLTHAPQGSHITAVELDNVAARAAQHLHPHASVHSMAFEHYTTRSSDAPFDLIVANPPYGVRGYTRHLHHKEEHRSERYFMRQLIKRAQHQHGLLSVLIPLTLLHSPSHASFRQDLLSAALPLHAVLIPTGAFKAAGAGVTTVLLILRRHDYGVQEALSTLEEHAVTDVLYDFTRDADHQQLIKNFIAGTALITPQGEGEHLTYRLSTKANSFVLSAKPTWRSGRYDQPLLEGDIDLSHVRRQAIAQQLSLAARHEPVLYKTVLETVRSKYGDDAAHLADSAASKAELHAIAQGTLSTDQRYVFRLGEWVVTDDFASPAVHDAVQVSQALNTYLYARNHHRLEARTLRQQALALSRAYLSAHGAYDRQRFSRLIPRYSLFAVLLVHLDEQGQLQLPCVDAPSLPLTASGLEGIAMQLADLLALDEQRLAQYAGVSEEAAAAFLVEQYAFNGEVWVEPGLYYSGHALLRAQQARQLAQQHVAHRRSALLRQADVFLSRVKRASLSELSLSPRDAVLPVVVLEAWVNAYLCSVAENKELISVRRENSAVRFKVKAAAGQAGVRVRNGFDHQRARALEAYLNHKTEVKAVRGKADMTREQYKAGRALAIDEAQSYEDQLHAHFNAWLSQSPFVSTVEDAYSWARGAVLRPIGQMRELNLPGWAGPPLHPYQVMDIRSSAATTGMVNAYDVGLGKTLFALGLVAYLKARGKAARPILIVPAGLVSNWAVNARNALPQWNIVTVGMSPRKDKQGRQVFKVRRDGTELVDKQGQRIEAWKEDSPAVKREKIASLAAGTPDLVIMSREAFTSIPMLEETRSRLIMNDAQYQRNVMTQEKYETGAPKRGKYAELTRQMGLFGAMMSRVKVAAEGELCFELLGCDFTAHDEGHANKNCFAPPTTFGETPRFLGGGGESQRALDALHKGRYVREQGGSTFSLTASWVKNSPIEVYSMLSMVMDNLSDYGLPTTESLMEQYLRIEPQIVTGMDGSVDVKPCVVGFRRLRELKAVISGHVIARTYGDPEVITRDGQPLHVPAAAVEEVMIDLSAEQQEAYVTLRERARLADAKAKGDKHPFSILWEMRKVTVDPALKRLGGPNPRFEKITELALENRKTGGKGIVFLSIGEQEGSFERLKRTLVAAGYPEHEIAIVSSYTHKSSVERQDLEDDYNYGDLSLILGTDVLGQGFNLQVGMSLIINADIPWNYEEIRQRVGRGVRQGNTVKKVRNVYLLMRGSFDGVTYTLMSGKKSWLSQLWGDVDELENTGAEFNGEEMALLLSDDPEKTRAEIKAKKTNLEELTGRAALKRKLEVLNRVLNAQYRVNEVKRKASARKNGWTAHDHTLLTNARAVYTRLKRELDVLGEWDFARLLDYTGKIEFIGMLPVHVGMTLQYEGNVVEVTQIAGPGDNVSDMALNVVNEQGQARVLSCRQFTSGTAFKASTHPAHYRASEQVHVPTISLAPEVGIHVLDGRRVNFGLKTDQEGVVTIGVKGNQVKLYESADEWSMRAGIACGEVVMRFAVQSQERHLIVSQVAVMSPSDRTLALSRQQAQSGAFRARLLQLAALALNAEVFMSAEQAA